MVLSRLVIGQTKGLPASLRSKIVSQLYAREKGNRLVLTKEGVIWTYNLFNHMLEKIWARILRLFILTVITVLRISPKSNPGLKVWH